MTRWIPPRRFLLRFSTVLAVVAALPVSAPRAQSDVRGWGSFRFDSRWHDRSYTAIAAGGVHTLALRTDGSIAAWGWNGDGQCDVPPLPAGLAYVEVAASGHHSLARRSDGS